MVQERGPFWKVLAVWVGMLPAAVTHLTWRDIFSGGCGSMRDSQRITHSCRYPCSPYYLYAVAACEPDGQSYDDEATQGEPDVADSHHRHARVLASEGPASGSQAQTIDVDTDGKIETEEQAYELMGKLIRMRKDNRARILYLSAAVKSMKRRWSTLDAFVADRVARRGPQEAKGLLRAMETYVAGKDEKLKIIEGKQLELKLLGGKTLRLNKRMKTLSEMFPSLAALVDFRRYDWLRKSSNEEHDSESPGGSTETSSATEEDQAATVEATEKCIGHLLRNIKNDTSSLARRRKLIATKESKAAEIHHTQRSAPPTSSGRAMSKMQLQTHATRIARAECDARKLEHRIQSRRYRLHKLREKMKLLKASAYQTHLAAGHTGTEPDRSAPLETKTTAPPLPKHLRHLEDVQRQDVASSDTERRMREPGFDGNIWRAVEENRTHCLASKELVHLTRPNELTQEDAHARTQKGGAGRARAGRLPTAILPNALAVPAEQQADTTGTPSNISTASTETIHTTRDPGVAGDQAEKEPPPESKEQQRACPQPPDTICSLRPSVKLSSDAPGAESSTASMPFQPIREVHPENREGTEGPAGTGALHLLLGGLAGGATFSPDDDDLGTWWPIDLERQLPLSKGTHDPVPDVACVDRHRLRVPCLVTQESCVEGARVAAPAWHVRREPERIIAYRGGSAHTNSTPKCAARPLMAGSPRGGMLPNEGVEVVNPDEADADLGSHRQLARSTAVSSQLQDLRSGSRACRCCRQRDAPPRR